MSRLESRAAPQEQKSHGRRYCAGVSTSERVDSHRSWSARLISGPMLLVFVGLVVGSLALTTPSGDGSYSCPYSALALISPEPEGRSGDGFDLGKACNHDARVHGAVAAGVYLPFAVGSGLWSWRRRRLARE